MPSQSIRASRCNPLEQERTTKKSDAYSTQPSIRRLPGRSLGSSDGSRPIPATKASQKTTVASRIANHHCELRPAGKLRPRRYRIVSKRRQRPTPKLAETRTNNRSVYALVLTSMLGISRSAHLYLTSQ